MGRKAKEDYSGAFAEAAKTARGIIARKLETREGMATRLAELDAEIAKLRGVIELANGAEVIPAKPAAPASVSMRDMIQVGEAYIAIRAKLAEHPDGIKHLALHSAMQKNGKPEYASSTVFNNLQKGLERGEFEKRGVKYFLKAEGTVPKQ